MGFSLGVLAQALTPGVAGHLKGRNAAEAETYKRQQEEVERQERLRLRALEEQLLRHNLEQAPIEAQRAAEEHQSNMSNDAALRLERLGDYQAAGTADPNAELSRQEILSRIAENRAQAGYYNRGRQPKPKPMFGDVVRSGSSSTAPNAPPRGKSAMTTPQAKTPGVPARYRIFPSEGPQAWVQRMKRLGVPPEKVREYGLAQGLQ